MSVPRKIHTIQLVKIQPEERLASELNLASSLVTGGDDARGMGAATQVKGLCHELFIVPEADVVHMKEGSTLIADRLNGTWQGDESPAGSETVARYQTDSTGLITYPLKGRTVLLKSRMRENLTSSSVRGLIAASGRKWL